MRTAFLLLAVTVLSGSSVAADFSEVQKRFNSGDYDQCIKECKAQVDLGVWNESWSRLLIQCYLTTGKYQEAAAVFTPALLRYEGSLRLRLLGVEVYRYNNDMGQANNQLKMIPELLRRMPWRYSGRDELVPLGQFFLMQGEDARKVLELCYDEVLKENPRQVEAHVASARLALDKHDDKVAAKSLKRASELDPTDPEIAFLSARAWMSSDSEQAAKHLEQALELNPKHIPSLLLHAENRIDGESFAEAIELLDKVLAINPYQPIAWAQKAVIAHLEGRFEDEGAAHRQALAKWPQNPEVDFTIGRQLSQHYRFREGVHYLRLALTLDPRHLPSRAQLAQDLLRLGETEEGWRQVDSVRRQDAYDVVTFNLSKLQETLAKFATLQADGLVVRMDANESKIYGQQVIELLSKARTALTDKYGIQLEEPVFIEIFPQQKDFAIRTFGLPGGQGFLGVCFGRLITANSPASQAESPSNWQSVLWHEYCHVVTLQKTKNRMPRWLSEGISVYEERQRDPTWGQSMDPTYRELIMGEDLVPVSKLSSAFLHPKTPMHLQFAYFESSMVIQYLNEKYGLETLKKVLVDLSVGMSVNDALSRYTGSLAALDKEFSEYLRAKATEFAGEADYEKKELPKGVPLDEMLTWLESHPKNVWGLQAASSALLQTKQWDKASELLERLQRLNPMDSSGGGVYAMLAKVAKERGDLKAERKALDELAKLSNDSMDAFNRLAELDKSQDNWKGVFEWTERLLAVNPLLPGHQELKAEAAEKLAQPEEAAQALQALLVMQPIDPASVHFRLAKALSSSGQPVTAKRQLLMALEEAPRYREALKMLVDFDIQAKEEAAKAEAEEKLQAEARLKEEAKVNAAKPDADNSTFAKSDSSRRDSTEAKPQPAAIEASRKEIATSEKESK